MPKRRSEDIGIGGDELGIVIATVCLIHCVFLSLLAVFVPWFLSRLGSGGGLHQTLAFLSLFIAMATLLPGHNIHRNRRVLVLGGMGLALLLFGSLAPQDSCCFVWLDSNEMGLANRITPLTIIVTVATPLGCGLLVAAHFLNRRSLHCRRSPSC